jgi:HlyD family secretion protein
MKRTIRTIIIIILGIGVGVGGYYAYTKYFSPAAKAASSGTQNYQTTTVKRGSLVATISATGSVRASQTANLVWQVNSQVGEVQVKLGQKVNKDDILAVLKPAYLPQNLIQAENDLITAQTALKDLYDNAASNRANAEKAIADAQKAVEDAQQKRDWLSSNRRADDITISKAEGDYYLALSQVDTAQEEFDNTSQLDITNAQRAQAQSNLAAAQSRARQAKWLLDYYQGRPDATDIAQAQGVLEVAKASLIDAQRQFDLVKNGPQQKDLTMAQNRVTMAESSVKQTRLEAPFTGTITDLSVAAGDVVSPGTAAMRIDDLSGLFIDLQVSEVDINRIQVEQPASLTFDAIPNQTYKGKVTEVGTAGTVSSGVVNFPVTVQVLQPDNNVKPGMTAGANVVVDQLDNVLLIPSRCVRTVSGKRVVFTIGANNALNPITVELGSVSDANVQVTGGNLKEGDVIVTNPPTQNPLTSGARPGGGQSAPGGGGGIPGG